MYLQLQMYGVTNAVGYGSAVDGNWDNQRMQPEEHNSGWCGLLQVMSGRLLLFSPRCPHWHGQVLIFSLILGSGSKSDMLMGSSQAGKVFCSLSWQKLTPWRSTNRFKPWPSTMKTRPLHGSRCMLLCLVREYGNWVMEWGDLEGQYTDLFNKLCKEGKSEYTETIPGVKR